MVVGSFQSQVMRAKPARYTIVQIVHLQPSIAPTHTVVHPQAVQDNISGCSKWQKRAREAPGRHVAGPSKQVDQRVVLYPRQVSASIACLVLVVIPRHEDTYRNDQARASSVDLAVHASPPGGPIVQT